ncbi:hypothetical protein pEaSNUABM14_00220 [Erwinia phage pEa_SNUABM_14]|uniref:Uncharacterized protein n=1 Tax=Erwinia phage pEa_SNUABM_7 TaxID=2866695 RepID=A0AAE7WT42_9CAUD|nr:hypothetical protein MPK74_gp221 [Erwinia phage pEa_SNUABM_7]QYW04545.1 hypothetical protein pEaSNUABM14_00220 [Erwinia phage pEa_SNUABM_14]QYW04889.1 hypothetical protein pEaSNUABM7_00221 [Erwinia phage pEa_SNUABM_7]QYW05234.1 hypothetical protein pEaSNUABM21_00220 [Erwinia phage pEa_SNUABM_21]QYW05576.1 hypothetical protein pEaSNUABM25_00220 [Erwinia phage pEa_SNUABM_25]
MTKIYVSLNSEKNGDMTNSPQPASDIPRSWPDENKLTDKIPFDPNQSVNTDDMFDPDAAVEGRAELRNGVTKPGAEGKKSRPDENFIEGARVQNEVESTHSVKRNALGKEVRFTKDEIFGGGRSFQDLFGNIFGDIFADRRVQRTMSRVAAEMETQSLSKGKSKSAKARSKMLKLIMPELSREQGERLAMAIGERDGETVERVLTQIGKKLNQQISRKK